MALQKYKGVYTKPEVSEHCSRVARICRDFAKWLGIGLSKKEREALYLGAYLHDLGKNVIPGDILDKQSHLTQDEFERVKAHPVYGVELANSLGVDDGEVKRIIAQHHERVDGKGYPNNLTDIDPLARIVSVVDAFDAMVNDRAYRPALATEAALTQIQQGLGQQFDKDLGEQFISFVRTNELNSD